MKSARPRKPKPLLLWPKGPLLAHIRKDGFTEVASDVGMGSDVSLKLSEWLERAAAWQRAHFKQP